MTTPGGAPIDTDLDCVGPILVEPTGRNADPRVHVDGVAFLTAPDPVPIDLEESAAGRAQCGQHVHGVRAQLGVRDARETGEGHVLNQ
jgi:hypothetical protein